MISSASIQITNAAPPEPLGYTFLSPLPGLEGLDKPDLTKYIPAVINLVIGISVVLAFIMITFGGVMYATTDAIQNKTSGKEYIWNAVIGLILVIGAYAILWTINPSTLSFNLSLDLPSNPAVGLPPVNPPPNTTSSGCIDDPAVCRVSGGILQGYRLTPEQVTENNRLRSDLASAPPFGILTNNGPCTSGGTSGCTNLVGLPDVAFNNLKGLASQCNCTLVVTGGTEGGHAEHRPGLAVYDLAPSSQLNTYLRNPNPTNGTNVTINGVQYTYETTGANGRASGNHWHAEPAK